MPHKTFDKQNALRQLPSVDKVMDALNDIDLPQAFITEIIRENLAAERKSILDGTSQFDSPNEIIASIRKALNALSARRLKPVINGTGVILHTNLGRSPLSKKAVAHVTSIAGGYSNLEFDLAEGTRGSRGAFLEKCLATLCGAEAATVVNNCAAGLIIVLRELIKAEQCEVIVSRGELVEIGGGFRIPEILETSGARLREVGTTNRTRAADYKRAIDSETGLILKVHQSNFYQEGFTEETSLKELVQIGKEHDLPVVFDLGSGAFMDTESVAPIPHEPTVQEGIQAGADLVCVSGDKLFGGPQAGIIAGRKELIQGIKRNPLFRALRCDKMVIAALQETALAYLHEKDKPDLAHASMLALSIEELTQRAQAIIKEIDSIQLSLGTGISRVGGGTMPKAEIPSATLDFKPANLSLDLAAKTLREAPIPVIAFVNQDVLKIDLRTVFPWQDCVLISALKELVKRDA